MIIFGIDPGMATSGYGVVECKNRDIKVIEMGWLTTSKDDPKEKRLISLYKQTRSLLKKHKPDIISIERLFFFINLKTAMVVAEFGGVIRLAAAMENVPLIEYAPLSVKLEVVGTGKADKKMVKSAVKKILHVSSKKNKKTYFDDVADALAMTICHARKCNLIARVAGNDKIKETPLRPALGGTSRGKGGGEKA